MNYTATFYLKSGATVLCQAEIDQSATKEEAEDGLKSFKSFVNNAIKKAFSGVVDVGDTHINIQEIAAYSFALVTK